MGPDEDDDGRVHRDRPDGGASAPEELVESIRALVHRYCRARLAGYAGGPEVVDSVAQDVSLNAVAALRGTKDRGAPLAAAVFSIASHQVAEAERRLRRPSTEGGPASAR